MFYVVAYDIPDDRRRTRIAKIMESFGDRVQGSVFECNMEHDEFERMRNKLRKEIVEEQDLLRIYRFCADCKDTIELMGHGTVSEDPGMIII